MTGGAGLLAAARAEPLDLAGLGALVAGAYPGAIVRDLAPMGGGIGSLLDLVELEGAPVTQVVLRRHLREFRVTADDVRREVAAMRVAAEGGLPVPRVLAMDPDGAQLGRPALLLERLRGRALVAELGDPAAAAALAGVVLGVGALPGAALGDAPRPRDLDAVLAHLPVFDGPSPLVDRAALLAATRRLEGAMRGRDDLVHCDLHGGNVLWDDGRVTGVLDWAYPARMARWYDESYARLDTTLAHGDVAGAALTLALEAADHERPGDDERLLWDGVALLTACPSPRPWAATYRAQGCTDATDEAVEERFAQLVERHLEKTR